MNRCSSSSGEKDANGRRPSDYVRLQTLQGKNSMFQHQIMYLPEVNRPFADLHGQQYLFSSHPFHFFSTSSCYALTTMWLISLLSPLFLFLGKDPFSNLQIWKNFILNFGSCVVCTSLVNPSNISLFLLSVLTSEKPDQQTNQQLEDLCI